MRGRVAAAAILAAALIGTSLAACGDEDDGSEPGTTAAEPTASAPAKGSGELRLRKLGEFDQPVFVAQQPGTEDLLVAEKPGRIRRLAPDGSTSTVLDIAGEVSDEGEQGLLSIAFAPDFESSRALFAYYTDSRGDQRVVRFELGEDGAIDPGTETDVLVMEDFAANHNGGLLLFGPDENLYIGTGDGGLAGDPERNGQDLGSLLGKILRIDPATGGNGSPYVTPPDNPFADEVGARPEIYSYGLRNPWRFSFDRETGDLAIGDVGQSSREEIDFVAAGEGAGANFGWSAFEAEERFNDDQQAPGHVPPVLSYGRDEGCSVTGGYVVRDPELPALAGRYLYGDYCAGELRSFRPVVTGSDVSARGDRGLGLEVSALSSFAEDEQGRIYATSLDGPVFRLVQ
ncbi:MAG TPA: PQQ-dependent sugar dehydrogenase [Solirubrobacterales bacterium]|nr:PQQ-dependent sugar dehydrogenase [Solirubrobacterales bacterium]